MGVAKVQSAHIALLFQPTHEINDTHLCQAEHLGCMDSRILSTAVENTAINVSASRGQFEIDREKVTFLNFLPLEHVLPF